MICFLQNSGISRRKCSGECHGRLIFIIIQQMVNIAEKLQALHTVPVDGSGHIASLCVLLVRHNNKAQHIVLGLTANENNCN